MKERVRVPSFLPTEHRASYISRAEDQRRIEPSLQTTYEFNRVCYRGGAGPGTPSYSSTHSEIDHYEEPAMTTRDLPKPQQFDPETYDLPTFADRHNMSVSRL